MRYYSVHYSLFSDQDLKKCFAVYSIYSTTSHLKKMNYISFALFIVVAIYLKSIPSFRKYSSWSSSHQLRYYPVIDKDAPCILYAVKSSADSGGGGGGGGGVGVGGGRHGGRKRITKTNEKLRPRNDPSWLPVTLNWRLYNIEVLLENDPGKGSNLVSYFFACNFQIFTNFSRHHNSPYCPCFRRCNEFKYKCRVAIFCQYDSCQKKLRRTMEESWTA